MFRIVITIFAATVFILEAKRTWCVVHDITKGNSSVALLSLISISLEKSRIKLYAENLKLTIFIIYIYTTFKLRIKILKILTFNTLILNTLCLSYLFMTRFNIISCYSYCF